MHQAGEQEELVLRLPGGGERARGIDQDQPGDLFAARGQLASHLEGDDSPHRPAAEEVGAGRLGFAERAEIAAGHGGEVGLRGTVGPDRRAQPVNRLVRPQLPREGQIPRDAAADGVYEEQRAPLPAGLEGDQRGVGRGRRPRPG